MDKPAKFLLPSPIFDKKPNGTSKIKPHFLTPSGMSLLPREKQPPPMYGIRGATVPAKYLVRNLNTPEPQSEIVRQYCEACELDLQSLEDLKRHQAQHEKCPVAGCHYRGHPTVIDKHINALHSSGLFEKLKKLNSPEEIATWRDERRKRFPTVANVLLKQKAQEQRQQRGERLEATRSSRFGKKEDKKRAQQNVTNDKRNAMKDDAHMKNNSYNQKNNRSKNKKKIRQITRKEKPVITSNTNSKSQAQIAVDEEEVPWHGLNPFGGTRCMKDYKHLSNKPKDSKPNVLFGLVGMYGSDDDSEEGETTTSESENTEFETSEISEYCTKDHSNILQKEDGLTNDDHNNMLQKEDGLTNEISSIIMGGELKITTSEVVREISETDQMDDICKEVTLTETGIENNLSLIDLQIMSPSNKNSENSTTEIKECNSSDEAPEETPIQRNPLQCQPIQEENKDDLIPPRSTVNSLPTKHKQRESSKLHWILKRKSGLDYRKLKLRKQNTMLEKLLETDIRHERNVLLQCVRFVCESNFLGVGSKI